MATRSKTYLSIQYLRGIAALLVVFHHSRLDYGGFFNPMQNWHFGSAGVDIFFVISGFIMQTAARNEAPLDYARRRVIRVAPLYWACTITLLAASLFRAPASHVVQSLLFIPHYNQMMLIRPYYEIGWTLTYEMFFYFIFMIGLACHRTAAVPILATSILALIGLSVQSHNAIVLTYTSPLLLEFTAGIIIAIACEKFSFRGLWPLMPIGFAGLLTTDFVRTSHALTQGIPAALIVIGALSVEKSGYLPDMPKLKRLGDSSYSLYLSQVFTLHLVAAVWHHLPLKGWAQYGTMLPVMLVASIIGGELTYRYVERPLGKLLNRKRRSKKTDEGLAVAAEAS